MAAMKPSAILCKYKYPLPSLGCWDLYDRIRNILYVDMTYLQVF